MRGCWGGGVHRIRRDTVNERAVRILLECILVSEIPFRDFFRSFTITGQEKSFHVSWRPHRPVFGYDTQLFAVGQHR